MTGTFDARFATNMKLMGNNGVVKLMNPMEFLTISYEIKNEIENNFSWVLQSKNGEIYPLRSSGDLIISDDVNEFLLHKISAIPNEFSLNQNFPNPFNPTTTIRYSLPQTSDVKLTIYNLNGQKVSSWVYNKMSPGNYSTDWDGTNFGGHPVSSGVYLYSLETESFSAMKKMILMK
jgi:hypothetical protein